MTPPTFLIKAASAIVGNRLAKAGAWAIIAVLAAAALWFAISLVTANPKARARLGANQSDAALESGADAVGTVGKAGDRETDIDRLTASNAESIHNADGATEAVTPAVRNAGLAALCRRAAYRDDPRCAK